MVAITAGTGAMPEVLEHVWTHLLPGLGEEEPPDGSGPGLADRLRDLALAPCVAGPRPPGGPVEASLPVVSVPGADDATAFTRVDLAEVDGQLVVTLAERDNELTFPVGDAAWMTSAPADRDGLPVAVSASGGWVDDRTLRLEVVFLESPHRLDVTCDLPERTASAGWRIEPMRGTTVRTLRRPSAR